MPDINPIAEGAKSLSEGLNQAREAGKSLTKSIENIQHDGIEVAQEQLEARKKHKLHEEAMENSMIYRAIQEYQNQSAIIEAENKAEKEFKSKYGAKEWAKVLELRAVVEKEHKENKRYYGHRLDDVRRVQFLCFFAAAIVTYFLWKFNLV
jgi:hypothetical protein